MVNISTAKNICKYCHIKFDDYFEQIFKVREYSAETIKGHRRILRTIFNEAVRYEWITKNPVCKTKVGASTSSCNISLKPIEEKEVFSLTEVKQFLKLLDELPEDLIYRRVTLKFMVLTGVRTAELHGLRWSDFDFDKRIVHIRRNRLATDGFGSGTIIRRNNVRRIALQNGIKHTISQNIILIDSKDFFEKVNPYNLEVHEYSIPKLRCIEDCAREWNNNRKTGDRFIHPDEIREFLKTDTTVFKYRYSNKWIVNYSQLLPHLKKMNRHESKMWKKYMQCLGIKKSVTPRKK